MRSFGIALILVALTSIASADTIKMGGNVINETWIPADGPYIIQGDITIPMGSTLTIQAGTVVRFDNGDMQAAGVDMAHVELVVKGQLILNGTVAQPVQFTSQGTTPGSWYGIVVDPMATGTAIMGGNVTMANPIVGIHHRSATATAATTGFSMTGVSSSGMRIEAGSPTYNGIATAGGSQGFEISGSASATLTNCIARDTTSYGARFVSSSASRNLTLTNCTFNANGSFGVYSSAASGGSVTIKNTIITSSSNGCFRSDLATWSVTYSNVWNNGSNNNSNYVGGATAGANTISTNPLYVSSTNLELTSNSPSRFGGDDTMDMGARPYTNVATPGLYGTLWTNTTLTAAASPYAVAGDLSVGPGVTLTMQAGTTLNFATDDIMKAGVDRDHGELTARGTLIINGAGGTPVILKSTGVVPGSWYGIVVDPAATGNVMTLSNVNLATPIVGIHHRSATATATTTAVSMTDVSSSGMRIEAGNPTYDGIATAGGSQGFEISGSASATLTNCVARNTTSYGARFVSSSASRNLTLINCTLNANGSFGVYSSAASGGSVTIINSIITSSSNGCFRSDLATWSVTYSDVWNNGSSNNSNYVGGASAGTGTISANPQYVSTTDLRLMSTSVAIDSGTATGAPAKDQRGAARPVNGDGINAAEFDMGAYEFAATSICGNGATEAPEVCDSGAMNGMYGFCNANCTGQGARCGDSMMNGPEQCDDGNGVDTDACRNTCIAATCGDGVIRAGVEDCDDNNTVDTDGCTAQCHVATCGDGIVRAGTEACDDGNAVDTDACHGCVVATCGDGIVRAGVEGCDDGNTVETDLCNNQCISTTCGDGVVQAPNEECDDGNDIDTDACRNACIDPICGDNIRQTDEQCDDGNMDDGDGCSAACRYETPNPGSDAGTEPGMDSDGGCCSSSTGGATSFLGALGLALLTRRRRRSSRR